MTTKCLFCEKDIADTLVEAYSGYLLFYCSQCKSSFRYHGCTLISYNFRHLNYRFNFWPLQPNTQSDGPGFELVEILEMTYNPILTLDDIPNVTPTTAEEWLSKILKMKAFL